MILDQLDEKSVEDKIDNSLPITDHILEKFGFTFKQTTLNTLYNSKQFEYWFYTDIDGADVSLEHESDDYYIGQVFFPQYRDSFLAPYGPEKEGVKISNVGELKKFIEASNKAAELRKHIRAWSKEIKSIVDEISLSDSVSKDIDSILNTGSTPKVSAWSGIKTYGKYNKVSDVAGWFSPDCNSD